MRNGVTKFIFTFFVSFVLLFNISMNTEAYQLKKNYNGNIIAVSTIASMYNLKSSDEGYNIKGDINCDGIIDLFDIVSVSREVDNSLTISNSDISTLDKTDYGWGVISNSNHTTPEVPSYYPNYLKNYDAMYVKDTSEKVIYLTFDTEFEVWGRNNVQEILNILDENDAKATFFLAGSYLDTYPDMVKKIVESEQLVACHSKNHNYMTTLINDKSSFENEIKYMENKFREVTGYEIARLFRPPYGSFSEASLKLTQDLGYTSVLWSFGYNDWDINNPPEVEYAKKVVLDNLHNGEILLMHPVCNTNVEILDYVIKEAKKQGYTFKSLQ